MQGQHGGWRRRRGSGQEERRVCWCWWFRMSVHADRLLQQGAASGVQHCTSAQSHAVTTCGSTCSLHLNLTPPHRTPHPQTRAVSAHLALGASNVDDAQRLHLLSNTQALYDASHNLSKSPIYQTQQHHAVFACAVLPHTPTHPPAGTQACFHVHHARSAHQPFVCH